MLTTRTHRRQPRHDLQLDGSMAHQLLRQPKLLILATSLLSAGCYETYDLDCDELKLSPSSVAETPMLEGLGVPVEDFISDLEEARTGELIAGDRYGQIPAGQEALDVPLAVQIELAYAREGELATPEDNPICELPHLILPVTVTVRSEGEILLTASGTGPIGWRSDGYPRADMDAVFEPKLWEVLGVEPPAEQEEPIASMFVFYRDTFADSIDINLQRCDTSNPECRPYFAHILWER